jgi:hypothetical protein
VISHRSGFKGCICGCTILLLELRLGVLKCKCKRFLFRYLLSCVLHALAICRSRYDTNVAGITVDTDLHPVQGKQIVRAKDILHQKKIELLLSW